jgi:hypothetical protein
MVTRIILAAAETIILLFIFMSLFRLQKWYREENPAIRRIRGNPEMQDGNDC